MILDVCLERYTFKIADVSLEIQNTLTHKHSNTENILDY